MSKRKSPKKVSSKSIAPVPSPVLQGDCFRTFLAEAMSIGNECTARREFDDEVIAYLREKGLFDEWSAWREAKHAPKTAAG